MSIWAWAWEWQAGVGGVWGRQQVGVGVERAEEGDGDGGGGVNGAAAVRTRATNLGSVATFTHTPASAETHPVDVSLRCLTRVSSPDVMFLGWVLSSRLEVWRRQLLLTRVLTRSQLTQTSLINQLTAGVVSGPTHRHTSATSL